MPSQMVSTNPTFRERDRARAASLTSRQTVAARGPWMGYVPDLPLYLLDYNYCQDCQAISARADTTGGSPGEVIMLEPGWLRVDNDDPATSLPIGTGNTDVVWIGQFNRTTTAGAQSGGDNDNTVLALVAGDGSAAGSAEMHRVNNTSSDWEAVPHSGFAGTTAPKGDRDALPDACTFAAGAPARTDYSSAAGSGIDEPTFIWTNNIDPVYVHPADSTDTAGQETDEFEDLTAAAALAPFLAKSCEVFNNRVYFLNTSESGVRYRQRLRRTPPFTCDPDPAGVGAGALDLKDYTGDGLRAERLGNVLVLYFEDGVAFVRPTGNYTAPDAIQTISTSRGLISTHSVVNLGNDLHFGIFTDGWFELDPSGRFREVGLANLGNGIIKGKWKDTFYSLLAKDPTIRGRLYCYYDNASNRVYIALPTDYGSSGENSLVWIYDRQADRIWLDNYEVICFGEFDRQLSAAKTYTSIAPKTYSSIAPATYASLGAQFGLKAMAHGTSNGYVFQHEPDFITRDVEGVTGNNIPGWRYKTHPLPGENPHTLMTADRVLVEHIDLNSPNMNVTIGTGPASGNESHSIATDVGTAGEIRTSHAGFRTTGRQLYTELSGGTAFMVKSFQLDILDDKVEFYGDTTDGGS